MGEFADAADPGRCILSAARYGALTEAANYLRANPAPYCIGSTCAADCADALLAMRDGRPYEWLPERSKQNKEDVFARHQDAIVAEVRENERQRKEANMRRGLVPELERIRSLMSHSRGAYEDAFLRDAMRGLAEIIEQTEHDMDVVRELVETGCDALNRGDWETLHAMLGKEES